MTLRKKLLLYFSSLIFFTLITFGLSTYQTAYNIVIEKDKKQLEKLTNLESKQLSKDFHKNNSLDEVINYLTHNSSNNHYWLIIDEKYDPVGIQKKNSSLLNILSQISLREIANREENRGKITINGDSHIWAKSILKNTKYTLFHIDKSEYHNDEDLKKLATRLFIIAIIILWIAVWIALIISTVITKKVNIQQKEIKHQAAHDIVTGLINRQYFSKKIDIMIKKGNVKHIGIVAIWLNRFREINDSLGYEFGDKLLRDLGARLIDEFWLRDTVANFGGDQFALLLPMTKQSDWRDTICKTEKIFSKPFFIHNINILVDVSVGISLYPENGNNSLSLIKCAEVAMRNAQKKGLFYESYNIENDPNNIDRLELISELSYAIERDEFELYYQPKVDIKKHSLIGAEALIRWKNPKRGFVRPDIFIELAEQGSIIKDITKWVVNKAIKQCAMWHKSNRKYVVSVNLSACLLIEKDIVNVVEEALNKYEFDTNYLILEITETAIVMDPKRALETMNELKSLGLQLSIDDFGTGYTSISQIKNLPVSEIKVDKSFVLNMISNIEDATVVKLIIDLAHTLNYKVVAEGIENQEILDSLNEMGCEIAQGFYLGKPMPVKEFDEFKLK